MDAYCGIKLTGDRDEDCTLAFITEDGVDTYSTGDDQEIMDLIEDYRPHVIALNAPPEPVRDKELVRQPSDDDDEPELDPATAQQFRSGEEELVEDGYTILPTDMRDRRLLERAEFLSNSIQRTGIGSQIIESNPKLVSQRLDITDDQHLEAYGVDTSDIDNVWEFDAVLLAYTAKQYAEDNCDGEDIVLPEDPME